MARVIVESVTATGFGRYGDNEQTLKLGGRGAVGVVGPMGSGKSTIASKALCWCLFGKTAPERMGTSTRALSGRSIVADECIRATVVVQLSDRESGTRWTIERSRTRTKADTLIVVQEGDNQAKTLDDGQAAIHRIVGCDYHVFTRTCLRGQGDPWAFAEATDKRKRQILDVVSGAVELDAPLAKAKAAVLTEQEAERRALGSLSLLSGQRWRIDLDDLKRSLDNWESSKSERLASLEATVLSLERAEVDAGRLDREAVAHQGERSRLMGLEPRVDVSREVAAVQTARRLESVARQARTRAQARYDQVAHLAPGSDCGTCGQVVSPTAPIVARRAEAWQFLSAATAPADDAAQEVRNTEQAEATAVRRWQASRARWRQQLQAVPHATSGHLRAAKQATIAARTRLDDARKGDNPHRLAYERSREDAARLNRDIAVTAEGVAIYRHRLACAQAWVKALSPKGVRAHLSESVLGGIEQAANHWLSALTGGGMAVSFPPKKGDREEIRTIVHTTTPAGKPTTRDLLSFSGGEKARINMAVDLGVATASSSGGSLSLSLLVLDEAVFSGLDEAGKAAMVAALHDAGVADIVIIDHDPRLSGVLPRTVRATIGPDGYSRLTEERR